MLAVLAASAPSGKMAFLTIVLCVHLITRPCLRDVINLLFIIKGHDDDDNDDEKQPHLNDFFIKSYH